ncbi:hypothetical protein CUN91_00725 [Candidatus Carsonella ruddii]|uniref:Uncharacterized protein n=1 Tax=Carsonella ruddii TaxID=114186 RepID=A0A2K8K4E4_CARRU|nr:hypothetical protein [Candidatus Carsonella ruddii]ATX33475.1 hypothetical protein CUN91_00725 [Candidatus Carsonella ruddii]
MKFKYKIKIFNKIKNNNKIILGDFINNNKIINIYTFNNNYLKKILKNNFLIVVLLNKIYFTFIKKVVYSTINNKIKYFILETFKKKFKIYYKNNNIKNIKTINFINNNFYPRSINLNIIFKKKFYSEKNFSFFSFLKKKNKLFFNKI